MPKINIKRSHIKRSHIIFLSRYIIYDSFINNSNIYLNSKNYMLSNKSLYNKTIYMYIDMDTDLNIDENIDEENMYKNDFCNNTCMIKGCTFLIHDKCYSGLCYFHCKCLVP